MCLGPEIVAAVQTIGAIVGIGGTAVAYSQSQEQSKDINRANAQAEAASRRAEQARLQQSILEAAQRRREFLRQRITGEADALSTIAGQTGSIGGSAAAGIQSSGVSEFGRATNELAVSESIRNDLFAANAEYSVASGTARSAQNRTASGGTFAKLGGQIYESGPTIGKLFGRESY